jgi:hypothetical protein
MVCATLFALVVTVAAIWGDVTVRNTRVKFETAKLNLQTAKIDAEAENIAIQKTDKSESGGVE